MQTDKAKQGLNGKGEERKSMEKRTAGYYIRTSFVVLVCAAIVIGFRLGYILLVGELNNLMKDLNKNLSRNFYVQLGSENVETLSGMLKVVELDLVIICLVGLYEGYDSIFQMFQNEYPEVPVLTIGTKEEWSRF